MRINREGARLAAARDRTHKRRQAHRPTGFRRPRAAARPFVSCRYSARYSCILAKSRRSLSASLLLGGWLAALPGARRVLCDRPGSLTGLLGLGPGAGGRGACCRQLTKENADLLRRGAGGAGGAAARHWRGPVWGPPCHRLPETDGRWRWSAARGAVADGPERPC